MSLLQIGVPVAVYSPDGAVIGVISEIDQDGTVKISCNEKVYIVHSKDIVETFRYKQGDDK